MASKDNQKTPVVYSDFWYDRSSKNIKDADIQKLLAMSEIQRAIGNFVQIISPKRVPVLFRRRNSYTDGESVVIASVKDKNFDSTCGLALHEASHIKYSNKMSETVNVIQDYVNGLIAIGTDDPRKFNNYGIDIYTHKNNIRDLQNWIEDRRIDALVKEESPGYAGYYEAMYDFYFRSENMNKAIASSKYRKPDNLDHYFRRIINFLSPATDLDALPGLRLIWNTIDYANILRLKSSYDSLVLAATVYDIILSYFSKAVKLRQNPKPKKQEKPKQKKENKSDEKNESEDNDDSEDKKDDSENDEDDSEDKKDDSEDSEESDENDSEDKDDDSEDDSKDKDDDSENSEESDEEGEFDESKVDDDKDSRGDAESEAPEESHNGEHVPEKDEEESKEESEEESKNETKVPTEEEIEDEIQKALDEENEDENPLTKKAEREAEKDFEHQKEFLNGEIEKELVSERDNAQLELLEKSKAKFIPVECRDTLGNLIKIDVLSIEHIPIELFTADPESKDSEETQILNKIGNNQLFNYIFSRYIGRSNHKIIEDGIKLGKLLGSKLKIRTEERVLKTTRQAGGKIDKRIIHLASADIENIFCSMRTSQFNKVVMHISIDASGSMSGSKFEKALQTAAAICSAADVVKNIEVTVSVRTTTAAYNVETKKVRRRARSSRRYGYSPSKIVTKSTSVDRIQWPTVVTIYNSKKDKLNKITKVWPWLTAGGSTPESITYEAERKLMSRPALGTDAYFITITDGAPADSGIGKNEKDEPVSWGFDDTQKAESAGRIDAVAHTRFQVNQMNKDGVATMAFFVSDMERAQIDLVNSISEEDVVELQKGYASERRIELIEKYGYSAFEIIVFKKCYGKDGVTIDSTNIIQLARAMNQLFLKGNPFQS